MLADMWLVAAQLWPWWTGALLALWWASLVQTDLAVNDDAEDPLAFARGFVILMTVMVTVAWLFCLLWWIR